MGQLPCNLNVRCFWLRGFVPFLGSDVNYLRTAADDNAIGIGSLYFLWSWCWLQCQEDDPYFFIDPHKAALMEFEINLSKMLLCKQVSYWKRRTSLIFPMGFCTSSWWVGGEVSNFPVFKNHCTWKVSISFWKWIFTCKLPGIHRGSEHDGQKNWAEHYI